MSVCKEIVPREHASNLKLCVKVLPLLCTKSLGCRACSWSSLLHLEGTTRYLQSLFVEILGNEIQGVVDIILLKSLPSRTSVATCICIDDKNREP